RARKCAGSPSMSRHVHDWVAVEVFHRAQGCRTVNLELRKTSLSGGPTVACRPSLGGCGMTGSLRRCVARLCSPAMIGALAGAPAHPEGLAPVDQHPVP